MQKTLHTGRRLWKTYDDNGLLIPPLVQGTGMSMSCLDFYSYLSTLFRRNFMTQQRG